ncbi:hypothetical protein Gorai_007434, partial [Gossypium raimondii]|nr:hypothetical protein [Gossypium raimondii]
MKFVETLGVVGLDDDLKLREFSKSLTEKAYTWYVNLKPIFVESWNQMCAIFGEKFFSTQEKRKILNGHKAYDEKQWVKVCI